MHRPVDLYRAANDRRFTPPLSACSPSAAIIGCLRQPCYLGWSMLSSGTLVPRAATVVRPQQEICCGLAPWKLVTAGRLRTTALVWCRIGLHDAL